MAVRNFRWDDTSALVDLENSLRQAQGDASPADEKLLREYWGQPNLGVEENCFIYDANGDIKGYVLVCPEPPIKRSMLELKVHPSYLGRGVEQVLVREALKRARELGSLVLHTQAHQGPTWERLLLQEGFTPVRAYWAMRWNLKNLPPAELPNGFYFRSYGGPRDAEALTRIQNAAFSGSWGFSPNTADEISYRANMSNTSHPGIIFLNNGDTVAGYCWTFIVRRDGGTVGVISMIGIDPAYRQLRLGRPLLQAGLNYLSSREVGHVELEVDGQNRPAIRLYLSVGFEKAGERQWFQASLEASPSGT